jgi:histidinol dehydrogenase
MKIIKSSEFDSYWKTQTIIEDETKTGETVKEIIKEVRENGDSAVRKFASMFDKSSPQKLEVPIAEAKRACELLCANETELANALKISAVNISNFSMLQRKQFADFEVEAEKGLFTGQRVIPVERAAVYIPGGRFPLFSSVLMCLIPAFCAGVNEVILSSPPAEDGLPNQKILAAAAIAAEVCGVSDNSFRIFAIGGAQAIAALAYGTVSVPRVDVIAGPGNKFVSAAKKLLYGQVGIDFIAGPSDVLVIADGKDDRAADLVAADMLAQAEHDPDARARALVATKEFADKIAAAIERRLAQLPTAKNARASLDNGGLIVIYKNREEAIRIANTIAPEHLELQIENTDVWIPQLKNYGSLFIGALSAEALGDYSAGINHTLPTSGSARFTAGLSVRHFLKTVTTLRCTAGSGFEKARNAAQIMAKAEGLEGHALSAIARAN